MMLERVFMNLLLGLVVIAKWIATAAFMMVTVAKIGIRILFLALVIGGLLGGVAYLIEVVPI